MALEAHDNIWTQILNSLRTQMTSSVYSTNFGGSKAEFTSNNELIVYPSGQASLERIKGHWTERIEAIAEKLLNERVKVVFQLPLPDVSGDTTDSKKIAITGTYYDERNKLIKPSRIFSGTQYFRKKWLPLLGPTLAWLIVEMRQRCYYGRGEDENQRDHFVTTYDDLAKAIGVSERQVQRLLARDKNGHFSNEYVSYFVKDITTIKKRVNGNFRNFGTEFVVYLDEPLTPEDEAKLSN